jgi:hypothetical protein
LYLGLNTKNDTKVEVGGYGGWIVYTFVEGGAKISYRIKYFHGSGGGGVVTKGTIQFNRMSTMVEGADLNLDGTRTRRPRTYLYNRKDKRKA